MAVEPNVLTPETALQRIDEIVGELLTLRQIVQMLVVAHAAEAPAVEQLPSVLDIIEASPGHRVFQSADDVTRYLQEERAAWGS